MLVKSRANSPNNLEDRTGIYHLYGDVGLPPHLNCLGYIQTRDGKLLLKHYEGSRFFGSLFTLSFWGLRGGICNKGRISITG